MFVIKKIPIYFTLCFLLVSCNFGWHEIFWRPDDVAIRSNSIIDLPDPTNKKQYSVLLLTDVHLGKANSAKESAFFDWLYQLEEKPEFCLVLGDITDHGFEHEYQLYQAFSKKIEEMGIPVYGLVGNHDLYNGGWRYWKKYVFPYAASYRFHTDSFSWYMLDTGNGTLGNIQLHNLEWAMKNDPLKKLVFTHYPVYGGGIFYFTLSDTRGRALVLDLFARYSVVNVFAGHWHDGSDIFDYGKFKELVLQGFQAHYSWGLLFVNEDTSSVSFKRFSAD